MKIESISNNVPQNTSIQKEPILKGELTGYPSIDKPWMKYYPDELISMRKKSNKMTSSFYYFFNL